MTIPNDTGPSSAPSSWKALAIVVGLVMILAAVPFLGLWASPARGAPAEVAQAPTVIRVGWLQQIKTLNPVAALEDAELFVTWLLYDSLIGQDDNLNPAGDLVESWELLDGNARWRLHLNTNAAWHDGTDFTSADVEFSINLYLTTVVWTFDPQLSKIDHVQVIDADTIDLYMVAPMTVVWDIVAPILPEHIWRALSPNAIQYTFTNPSPVGSGAWKWPSGVTFTPGMPITLEKNPTYHRGAPVADRLVIAPYTSADAMAQALRNDEIDLAKLEPAAYDGLAGAPGVFRFETPVSYWLDVGWGLAEHGNQGNPVFRDPEVRRALSIATDKAALNQSVWRGHAIEGSTLIPYADPYWHYEPNRTEKYFFEWNTPSREPTWAERLALANATLEAAGYVWSAGEGPGDPRHKGSGAQTEYLSGEMLVRTGFSTDLAAAQFLQAWWANIGVVITIQQVQESVMETEVYGLKEDLYIWYWSGYPDASNFLGVQICAQAGLWSDNFWCNNTVAENYPGFLIRHPVGSQGYQDMAGKTFSELFDYQLTIADRVRRKVITDEMSRQHYFDQAFLIMAYPYDLYAWTERHWTGWDFDQYTARTLDFFRYTGNMRLFIELQPVGVPNAAPVLTPLAPYNVHVNDTLSYQATASDADGDTLRYTWSFGDGTALQVGNPLTHKYTAQDNYTLQVWVDDGQGHNVTSTTWVNVVPVGVNLPPSNVAITGPATVTVNTSASFSASAVDADGDPLSYYWTFGDGSSATGAAVSHAWTTIGTKTVTVYVNDGQGHNVSRTKSVTVQAAAPPPGGGISTAAIVGAAVAIIVVAGVLGYLLLRRRKGGGAGEGPGAGESPKGPLE